MVELHNVEKTYKNRKFFGQNESVTGVSGLNLAISPGAFGLLGINGAGKTTTLKMIATLLQPSTGRITVNGVDTCRDEKKLRSKINMITGSDRMLYFRLTGSENLHYFASLYGMRRSETKNVVIICLN